EFEHIHVIKKLKHILGAWWNVDTVFTDDRGVLRGFQNEKVALRNPLVKFLFEKEAVIEQLTEFVNVSMEELRASGNRYSIKKWDLAGFDAAIVPIYIENDFVGTVVSVGFFKDNADTNRTKEV